MTDEHGEIERTAAAWLARRDAGGWSDRQQAALDAWLAEAIAHRVAFLRLEAVWEETARLKTLGVGDAPGHMPARGEWAHSPYFASPLGNGPHTAVKRSPSKHATTRRHHRRWPLRVSIAASLLIVVAIAGGLAWREFTHVERGAWRTALGAKQVVHLSDGSVATLGSDTELSVAFSRPERDLDLRRGEAFFDVAHDSTRPFVVHAGGYRVIAVGTRFDVQQGVGKLRVVVTRGLVRLQSAHDPGQPPAMLPAGSIALVDGDSVAIRHVALDQAREYLSWRSGYAVFHSTPLVQAIGEFNRYNKRKIVIADPSLDTLRVGGHFRLDNSAAFVRLMQEVFPVKAEQRGDHIVLLRRPR